jgi:hypothetical protein
MWRILGMTAFLVGDWSKVDKEDYLPAMEKSPIKDVEIKMLLKNALTDKTDDREVYMKGIDASYHYEGDNVLKHGRAFFPMLVEKRSDLSYLTQISNKR